MNKTLVSVAGIVLVAALVLGAVLHLFQLRFTEGDIYPPYSSYRADPRGTKVLYESFDRLPGVETRRNLRDIFPDRPGVGDTVVFAGVTHAFSRDRARKIEEMARNGARVVVAYYPFREEDRVRFAEEWNQREWREEWERRQRERGESKDDSRDRKSGEEEEARRSEWHLRPTEDTPEEIYFEEVAGEFGRLLGFALHARFLPEEGNRPMEEIEVVGDVWSPSPPPRFWLGRLHFEPREDAAWSVLLTAGGEPVFMERRVGDGSVVVFTDPHSISNEGLRLQRRADFLVWLAGTSRRVIFDETHHGVFESPGVAALVRRQNLEPLFLALAALALLLVWRNAAAFPPRRAGGEGVLAAEVDGRDSTRGLLNLLRAHLPRSRLLANCWEQRRQTLREDAGGRPNPRLEEAARVAASPEAASGRKELLQAYRRITEILNDKGIKK